MYTGSLFLVLSDRNTQRLVFLWPVGSFNVFNVFGLGFMSFSTMWKNVKCWISWLKYPRKSDVDRDQLDCLAIPSWNNSTEIEYPVSTTQLPQDKFEHTCSVADSRWWVIVFHWLYRHVWVYVQTNQNYCCYHTLSLEVDRVIVFRWLYRQVWVYVQTNQNYCCYHTLSLEVDWVIVLHWLYRYNITHTC